MYVIKSFYYKYMFAASMSQPQQLFYLEAAENKVSI